MGAGLRGAEKS